MTSSECRDTLGYRIGVDIGGTFTDFALFDDAAARDRHAQALTTPRDPAQAVIEGVEVARRAAGIAPADVAMVVHGTTLVTNAVIERKGAPTGDARHRAASATCSISRIERRYDLFDLRIALPAACRAARAALRGRRARQRGTARWPSRSSSTALREAHRRRHRAAWRRGSRGLLPPFLRQSGARAARSPSGCASEFPELSRLGVVGRVPIHARIRALDDDLPQRLRAAGGRPLPRRGCEAGLARLGFRGKFLIMSSSGGTLTAEIARRFPIRLLESGPAAGALMSARHGRDLGAAADAVLRHGRHHRQGLHRSAITAAQALRARSGARARVQARQRPAGQDPGDRHDRDRRRRRQHRRDRRARRARASARAAPAPIPGPPATAAAARSRR